MKKRFSIEYNEGKPYLVDWHFEFGNKMIPDDSTLRFAQEVIPILNRLEERIQMERNMGKTNRYIADALFKSMDRVAEEKEKGNIIVNDEGTFIRKEAELRWKYGILQYSNTKQ